MYSLFSTDVSLLLVVLLLFPISVAYLRSQTYKLRHIPSVGSNLPILSYIDAFRFLFHAQEMIAEGTRRYPDGIFKIPDFLGWIVVVTGPKLIAEYRKVPEHLFSSRSAFESTFQHEYTFHHTMTSAPRYHLSIIKSQLTRSIGKVASEMHDEVVAAFDEYLQTNVDGEWGTFPVLEIMPKLACRANNRVFVGFPLCRDPDFLALSVKRTAAVVKTAVLLGFCPKFLRSFVTPLISEHRKELETVQRLLTPFIEARRQELAGKEEYAAATDQGTDVLTWLLTDPIGKNSSNLDLTCRVLILNFASIHTTSMTTAQALYDLAAYPEYAEPLREEAARVVERDGWTKAAISNMDKIDSFLKESMRVNTISELLMPRIAVEDYTFAQTGTLIPRGTFLHVATREAHFDGNAYADPSKFDGLRFFKLKSQAIANERQFDLTTTSPESVPFGTGIHACPGRFFVASEMKLMLAHLVLNYDIKFEKEGVRPLNKYFQATCFPDPAAKILFRRRKN
ncbi:cytochrome P450 [Phlegmacium glaucopus]|nr:cytochrome P450 [Phlegmacium glaucopus]